MFKKFLTILFVSAILPFHVNAQWISLDNTKASNTPPKVTVLSDDNSSTVIKIDISGFQVGELNMDGKSYQSVDLLSEIFTTTPDHPELPYISKVLAIPDQAGISVEVLETGKVQTFKNIHIKPARESWVEGNPEDVHD